MHMYFYMNFLKAYIFRTWSMCKHLTIIQVHTNVLCKWRQKKKVGFLKLVKN